MTVRMFQFALWPLFFLCAFGNIRVFLAAQPYTSQEIYCSRERSRTAWKIIDEYLLPFVEQVHYSLPESCRLHPNNDVFREQEANKEHITTNQWQCSYCKKMFQAEKYLDKHFDNRHSEHLNYTRDRCLADMCGALHCDYYNTLAQSKHTKRKCNAAASERNLHLCESLAKSCFPPQESSTARKLHDFFLRQFCDAHKCKKGVKPFPRGNGRSGDQALYIALFVFVSMLLLLYYGGIYAYISDLRKNHVTMKRIQKPKPHKK